MNAYFGRIINLFRVIFNFIIIMTLLCNILKRYWYLRGTRLRDLRPVNTIVELFLRG